MIITIIRYKEIFVDTSYRLIFSVKSVFEFSAFELIVDDYCYITVLYIYRAPSIEFKRCL